MANRTTLRRILEDALHDRESYLDAVSGIDEYETKAIAEIADYKALRTHLEQGKRLAPAHRKTLRLAAIRAVSWREAYLDSVHNVPEMIPNAMREVRQARKVLDEYDGDPLEDLMARTGYTTLDDIRSKKLGTVIEEVRENGVTTRTITENGTYIGKTVMDRDGDIKAYLADGTIANEPFSEMFEAQQWVLDRVSSNLVMRSTPNDGGPGLR